MGLFVDVYTVQNCTISVNPGGRLRVNGKYIQLDFHPHCGPIFYRGDNVFEPENKAEEDALWEALGKWHKKFKANEERLRKKGKTIYRSVKERSF